MTKDERIDNLKNKISMALKDPILQLGFEIICKKLSELEKENAELKALIKSEHDIEARKNNSLITQLSKAKKLIEDIYDLIPASHSEYYKDVMERVKQFFKED